MTNTLNFRPEKIAEMVGEENVIEMLSSYLVSLQESSSQLSLYWGEGDVQHVRMTSHRMKSSARFIGADELAEEFQKIETDSLREAENICEQTARLSRVEQQCQQLIQEIRHYLESAH